MNFQVILLIDDSIAVANIFVNIHIASAPSLNCWCIFKTMCVCSFSTALESIFHLFWYVCYASLPWLFCFPHIGSSHLVNITIFTMCVTCLCNKKMCRRVTHPIWRICIIKFHFGWWHPSLRMFIFLWQRELQSC